MKKLLAIAAAAAIMAMAGTAMAATANLSVTANVSSTCIMTGGTLAFGTLDPTDAVAKTGASSGVSVTCTNGTTYALVGDDGVNPSGTQKQLTNGTSNIPYSLTIPASGTGTGAAVPVSITGNIAANSYTTATSGSYTDTIELTVTP